MEHKINRQLKSNEDITDITEVLEETKSWWFDRTDVNGYKWKLVYENHNEPTQVHFYKEDMTDTLSINLSTIFDSLLREYNHHLEVEKDIEERRVKEEIQENKKKLLEDKVIEVIKSYELFLKQKIKDEITKQDIKPNITNIRKMVDECSILTNGVHYGLGKKRMRSISISKEWYLENYDKLTQILFSIDPEHIPSSQKMETNNRTQILFMVLDDYTSTDHFTFDDDWSGKMRYSFYKNLDLLLRKMKKCPIGYWKS